MTDAQGPPPGFYDDPSGRRRWWNGSAWSDRYEVGEGEAAPVDESADADTEPRAVLNRAVATYVTHGYRVELNTGRQAVVAKRRRVQVLLNVALALLTGGLWLVVLAIRLLNWPTDRVRLTVDEHGVLTPEFF